MGKLYLPPTTSCMELLHLVQVWLCASATDVLLELPLDLRLYLVHNPTSVAEVPMSPDPLSVLGATSGCVFWVQRDYALDAADRYRLGACETGHRAAAARRLQALHADAVVVLDGMSNSPLSGAGGDNPSTTDSQATIPFVERGEAQSR